MVSPHHPRRGATLTELLVALLILELAGLGALAAALTADRIGRHVGLGSRTDAERWASRRATELDSTCLDAGPPRLVAWNDSANPARPAVTLLVRCGQ